MDSGLNTWNCRKWGVNQVTGNYEWLKRLQLGWKEIWKLLMSSECKCTWVDGFQRSQAHAWKIIVNNDKNNDLGLFYWIYVQKVNLAGTVVK